MSINGVLKLKAQLMSGSEPAIGPGRALVLEAIDQAGSISGAGRLLNMSYRRTWLHVDALNRCWSGPLVSISIGGGSDKGARLTPLGQTVLAAFRRLEKAMEAATEGADYALLTGEIRAEPLPVARKSR